MKPEAKHTIHSTRKELNCMCCSWLASRSRSKPLSYTSEEKKEARRYQRMLEGRGRGCCVELRAGKPNRPWEEANRLR